MSDSHEQQKPETVIAGGKIFELVQTTQPDGRIFETARRAPGVRIIIADKEQKKILLTKEFRHELNEWDYRLPGGKVFDTLSEVEVHRQSGDDILEAAKRKAREEALEEAGVAVNALDFVAKSTLGATVDWSLYVFETSDWTLHEDGQHLKEDEVTDIAGFDLYTYSDVAAMIMDGRMQEQRIALVLLQWITRQK